MKIDIQEIINQKVKDMEETKVVEKAIEDTLEKTILKAVTDALDGYSLKRMLEDKVTKEISEVVSSIGFTAYNSFIAEKVKKIVEDTCYGDISNKIQKTFNDILIVKKESIKLSEICELYRDYICENTEDEEKYSLERFHVEFEESEYGWLEITFAKEKPTSRYSNSYDSINFIVHKDRKDNSKGWIGSVHIDGYSIKEKLSFKNMSDVELLLVNLSYNQTPIIIDIEDEDDIDNHFDVDC